MTKLQETRTQLKEAMEIRRLLLTQGDGMAGGIRIMDAARADVDRLAKAYAFLVEQESKGA
jgi:hypothetical protein